MENIKISAKLKFATIYLIIIEAIVGWIITLILNKLIAKDMGEFIKFIVKFVLEWTPVFAYLWYINKQFTNQLNHQKDELNKQLKLTEVKLRLTKLLLRVRTQNLVNGAENSKSLIGNDATKNSNDEIYHLRGFLKGQYPNEFKDTEQDDIIRYILNE